MLDAFLFGPHGSPRQLIRLPQTESPLKKVQQPLIYFFFFPGFTCARSDPATDFWSFVDFLLLGSLDAFGATRLLVVIHCPFMPSGRKMRKCQIRNDPAAPSKVFNATLSAPAPFSAALRVGGDGRSRLTVTGQRLRSLAMDGLDLVAKL